MSKKTVIFLLFAMNITVYSQFSDHTLLKNNNFTKYYPSSLLPERKLKLQETNKFPDDFPFQFGAEAGYGFKEGIGGNKYLLWNVFADVNLVNKILFLKLEYARFDRLSGSDVEGYISGGISYKILNEKGNKIYIHAGLGLQLGINAFVLSSKYLFVLNKYVGFTFGPRFFTIFDKEISNFGFVVGIQLFTN